MNWAVPAFFHPVPAHDAMQVWADGGVSVNLALIILVNRNRRPGLGVQDASGTEAQALNVRNVALDESLTRINLLLAQT